MGIYAELRREFWWGNLDWGFFEGLFEVPRRGTEEGGTVVFPPRDLGEVLCYWVGFNGGFPVTGMEVSGGARGTRFP
jgi:hypothetical protein